MYAVALVMDGFPVLDVPLLGAHSLGDYQLVAEIGRGGMADVYLALAPGLDGQNNRVVIKRLRSDVLEEHDFRAMFLDEARLAQKLHHPNVVKTLDVGRDGEAYFIVMEFLDGQPLSRVRRQAVKSRVEIPVAAHLRILRDVLSGLHYVHELADQDGAPLGVVHRDVTPQNVFVTYDGQVKVVDFGIAKAHARQVETRVGVVKGKLSYIAPENVRGDHVDRRSDIFSVGVMLWEAATGGRFWHGMEELAIYQRLVSGELPTQSGAAHMSPEVFAIVERALAPRPADRFESAAEMLSAIDKLPPSQTASRTAVSGYLYQLFVEERRKFHQRIAEEVGRLEAGDWPIDLPNLRPESVPLSTPGRGSIRLRDPVLTRSSEGTPNSVRTSPTVMSFSSPSTRPTVPPPVSPRMRVTLLVAVVAAVALLVGVYALDQGQSAAHAKSTASASLARSGAHEETLPPAAVPTIPATQPTKPMAVVIAPPAQASGPVPVAAPAFVFHGPPMYARPLPKKSETPDVAEEIHREPRRKRSLDAEDPWAK